MEHRSSLRSRLTAVGAVIALTVSGLLVSTAVAPLASAAPGPVQQSDASVVTADALPTVQVDGVVWSQAIAGNTVYAGGKFSNARPAGAAPGTNQTPRSNLLAYDITTGNLITSFAPVLNGQVRAVAASPDGKRVYVGGDFTTVNGGTRSRIAAFDTATGALITTFLGAADYYVYALAATNDTVYAAGDFNNARGVARKKFAAFRASDGALLGWNPSADAKVNALVISPDGTKVIAGGAFKTVNGQPAWGMTSLDATTGAVQTWNANNLIRNAGDKAAILGLSTDGTSIYGNGFHFGGPDGNFEGVFSANPNTGDINWIEDCHGDTYSNYAASGAVYAVSHAHYCGNVGGAPQTDPNWTFQHAMAFSKNATGTLNNDPYGYFNYGGNPSPSIINWFPQLAIGSITGQSQAAWNITGNSQYVVLGGEFPRVNGVGQQGLVRFAVKPIAPAKQKPLLSGGNFVPNLISLAAGTVRVGFKANYDYDDTTLTYELIRNGVVVQTQTANSTYWNQPNLGFVETGLTPGTQYKYQIRAIDSSGNTAVGSQATITPSATGTISPYVQLVKDQGATSYWRLGETSGSAVYDWAQFNDATAGSGVGRGAAGAINGDSNTAATFDGTDNGRAVNGTAITAPDTYTTEAWFKTTTTSGGKIIGFGNNATGDSGNYDRHVYMDNAGKIFFGVHPGGVRTLNTSKAYNDGEWHQVVATLGPNGMALYVDGLRVAQRADVTSGQPFSGYWKVGGDNIGGWTNQPNSNNFNGSIDDVSIYPTALTGQQVVDQYVASGRTSPIPPVPADAYGAAVYNDQPDLYYRLGETNGAVAADSSAAMNPGAYVGGNTKGVTGSVPGANTAVTFNGSDGFVASGAQVDGPSTYSEEAWFKTTTTSGGKIIGFGSNATGTSGSYDRHVYMQDNGQLVFGTWTGQTNVVVTPATYNNDQWHHVVATQSGDGMKLYVDGQLTGTNPQTSAQGYAGYWKIGGDNTWSSSSPYFAGTIDEAAVYSTALTEQQVLAHFTAGGGQLPNVNPVAGFTSTTAALAATVDAGSSTDSDGTIASYAWDFGDGQTGTGATATHTYAAGGTYNVTLTVTDNRGGTNTVTNPVTVAPNQVPVPQFTVTANNLALAVDAGTSTDPDGTVASYAWNFGDNSTGTGATATHTYAAAGTYNVTLTVTDNLGGTATLTQPVTATAPPVNKAPVAAFTSTTDDLTAGVDGSTSTDPDGTVASYAWNFGDGTTGTGSSASRIYAAGGTYTVTLTVTDDKGATNSVSHPVTVTAPPVPNEAPVAAFTSAPTDLKVAVNASASTDSDGTIVGYEWDFGDTTTGTGVSTSHTYGAAGTYTVKLTVTDDDGAKTTTQSPVTVTAAPPANVAPVAAFTTTTTNLKVNVDASTSTDSDGTIASYDWDFGNGATATGKTASYTFADAGTHQITLKVTDDKGTSTSLTKPVETQQAPNELPVALFTSTTADLTASLDAGTSSDPDGTIASYAWDFGDSKTGSGKTTSHAYTAGGTYPVTLTVTDNKGATSTVQNTVTVAPAPVAVFGSDQFVRTLASGWGTADQGGAWTLAGTTTNFSVGGGTGKIKMSSAGAGPAAWLNGLSQANVDTTVDVSLDKVATGGGTYVSVAARRIGTSDYRLKVRALAGGSVSAQLVKTINGVETVLSTQTVSGLTYSAGDTLRLRFQVQGTGSATLQGKVWKVGSAEPTGWQLSQTDSSAELQAAGGIGLVTYLSGSSTNAPVTASFDNLTVKAAQ